MVYRHSWERYQQSGYYVRRPGSNPRVLLASHIFSNDNMEARRPSLRERMAAARQKQNAASGGTGGSGGNGLARAYRTARKSGQLNLSSRGLASFPPEILKLHTLVEEVRATCGQSDSFSVLTCTVAGREDLGMRSAHQDRPKVSCSSHSLSSMDMHLSNHCVFGSFNELASLPSDLSSLAFVASWKMRHNQLTQLPETLWTLTSLVSLDLSK